MQIALAVLIRPQSAGIHERRYSQVTATAENGVAGWYGPGLALSRFRTSGSQRWLASGRVFDALAEEGKNTQRTDMGFVLNWVPV